MEYRYDAELGKDDLSSDLTQLSCEVCGLRCVPLLFQTRHSQECSGTPIFIFGPRVARMIVVNSLETGDRDMIFKPFVGCGWPYGIGLEVPPFSHTYLRERFPAACDAAETYVCYGSQNTWTAHRVQLRPVSLDAAPETSRPKPFKRTTRPTTRPAVKPQKRAPVAVPAHPSVVPPKPAAVLPVRTLPPLDPDQEQVAADLGLVSALPRTEVPWVTPKPSRSETDREASRVVAQRRA